MSRFQKLSHVLWHCQYHIVWVPKFRYRVLRGPVAEEVFNCIHVFAGRLGCEIIELNVRPDHVHLLVKVLPKVSISDFMGSVKCGRANKTIMFTFRMVGFRLSRAAGHG